MPITMRDVSAMAGVSISTVSHVVNNTRAVPDRTRQKVMDAIHATGFMPNTIARSLKRAETRTLGLAIGDISNPYFTAVVHPLEAAAVKAGYTLILTDIGEDPDRETAALQALIGRRVDGLILSPSGAGGAQAIAHAKRNKVPVVQIDRIADRDCDYVVASNQPDMQRLVRHLAQRGHKRIGMLAGLNGLSSTQERIEGYRLGLKDGGIAFDPDLMVTADSSMAPAHATTLKLLALPNPPTALVASNNLMALGALRAIKERRLSVPRDIALVAFDEFEWTDLFQPRLTTIAQPCQEIGEWAVKLMLDRLANPDAPPRHIHVATTLHHRESCGCPADAGPIA
ncbi:MAG TPA: LacI family DNA-binding transcriptional regulator [Magnetospirillaceae bacterium]|jgi:LacI family transcriptional regulator